MGTDINAVTKANRGDPNWINYKGPRVCCPGDWRPEFWYLEFCRQLRRESAAGSLPSGSTLLPLIIF